MRIVPFRESKLTRMFQNYLRGKGTARMVVNATPFTGSFDETTHVMKFSAVAKQVSTAPVASKIDTGLNASQRIPSAQDLDTTRGAMAADMASLESYNKVLLERVSELQSQLAETER